MERLPQNPILDTPRFDWVRMRTLIWLRWLALAGQGAALLVAITSLHLDIRLGLCLAVLAAAAGLNIAQMLLYPENRRLTERGALLTLLFDLTQLTLLLALTGGLANPFAMLLLTPVVIAATALNLRATVLIGLSAVLAISGLVRYAMPLVMHDGTVLAPPMLFIYGEWAALVISTVFLAAYAYRVTGDSFSMARALAATQMALDREQRLTALGGVVAATAHELGTPLATIKLVASELLEESGDFPDLADDLRLINQQAERCRTIMQSMGQTGKDDMLMRVAPLVAVIEEAAEPHRERGKTIHIRLEPGCTLTAQPEIERRPEIIHGLRNLVQNAVDYAYENVWIDLGWNTGYLSIRIGDDGPGYPSELIGRIGDPFVRKGKREHATREQEHYQGMGLGLFIAKTFLERCGAQLRFDNGTDSPAKASKALSGPARDAEPTGAIVRIKWPRKFVEPPQRQSRTALGENPLNMQG